MSKQYRAKMTRDPIKNVSKRKKTTSKTVERETELPSVSSFLTICNVPKPRIPLHSTPISARDNKGLTEISRGIPRNLSHIKSKITKIPIPETKKGKRMKQNDGDERKDVRRKGKNELIQMYVRLCREVNDNIKAIWENDDNLAKQDRELEKMMLLSGELTDEEFKWRRNLEEMKTVTESSKAEAQRQRVAHKTNLIEAEMFSMTADQVQEDIWRVRGEVIGMNYIQGCNPGILRMQNDNLKNIVLKEIQKNEKINKEIKLFEKRIEQFRKPKEVATNTKHGCDEIHSPQKLPTGLGERYVVLPKIHRRRDPNEVQRKDAETKSDPFIKIKKLEPLPAIGKRATTTEAPQTSNTQPVRNDSNAGSLLAPKPPAVKKSGQTYTRKNMLQRLKAFITD